MKVLCCNYINFFNVQHDLQLPRHPCEAVPRHSDCVDISTVAVRIAVQGADSGAVLVFH